MSNVIKIEGISKRYWLGVDQHSGALSKRLEGMVRAPWRRLRGRPKAEVQEREEFWALRDVSLEVSAGEILGVIGANGSGKSTLLKLLSQITPPTEGRITIEGRVGTLLVVGTGFHPELTGRENVYLNGAILGMRKAEIDSKFDEIVAFSGIDQFLDTPVKRYSSGMYVRLAFAVAAHLESEILLVDEVLAVGDAEFQRKCLGKMDEVARGGRTVIFVSHSLSTVQRLCDRAVWLQKGRLSDSGAPQDVIATYFERTAPRQMGGEVTIAEDTHRSGTGEARLIRAALLDDGNRPVEQLRMGQPWTLQMTFEAKQTVSEAIVTVGLMSADGTRVATAISVDSGEPPVQFEPGIFQVDVSFEMTLLPGDFSIDIGLSEGGHNAVDGVERALTFQLINVGHGDTPNYPWPVTSGYFRPKTSWSVARAVESSAPAVGNPLTAINPAR
jgi:lipopolysaccharide transport system ATP-binding protein